MHNCDYFLPIFSKGSIVHQSKEYKKETLNMISAIWYTVIT